eukprot:546456-Prorocentrum_minimum.AAC.1
MYRGRYEGSESLTGFVAGCAVNEARLAALEAEATTLRIHTSDNLAHPDASKHLVKGRHGSWERQVRRAPGGGRGGRVSPGAPRSRPLCASTRATTCRTPGIPGTPEHPLVSKHSGSAALPDPPATS